MNPIAFHIASGDAFFSGSVFWLLGIVAHAFDAIFVRRIGRLSAIVGTVLISISSTPIPFVLLLLFTAMGIVYFSVKSAESNYRRLTLICWFLTALVIVGNEARFRIPDALSPVAGSRLVVIGDSLSAGMNEPENQKWPALLAAQQKIDVSVYAKPGATTESILRTIHPFAPQPSVVLIEIGGNDVLQGSSHASFSRGLSELLKEVSSGGHRLVMMELPLPPFYNRFAATQRSLAKQFSVKLIPKRDFLTVIGSSGSTSDSLHLNELGHKRMASMVWSHLELAFH
jgi:acyl-CoA thioesterase-1